MVCRPPRGRGSHVAAAGRTRRPAGLPDRRSAGGRATRGAHTVPDAVVVVDDHSSDRRMAQYPVDQDQPTAGLGDLLSRGELIRGAHSNRPSTQRASSSAERYSCSGSSSVPATKRVMSVGGGLGGDALEDLREVRVAEVGHDHADRPAAAAQQRLGGRVRPVADLLRGRADPVGTCGETGLPPLSTGTRSPSTPPRAGRRRGSWRGRRRRGPLVGFLTGSLDHQSVGAIAATASDVNLFPFSRPARS